MNLTKENINEFKILEIVVGSNLYGTNTPTSDMDYGGVFIAPKDYYLGLKKIEQFDLSVVSKLESGKNDKDAVDITLYELRKFITLAADNNPNILEYLFTPKDQVVFSNSFGERILKNAHLFPHKGLKQKFLGYAFSQKHKMIIKTDNYNSLNTVDEWLSQNIRNPREEEKGNGYFSNQLLAELRDKKIPCIKFHEHHAIIGDMNISLTDKISKVISKVTERLSKVGNREELYTKYGYDTKFGMHLVRLMLEGKELLLTGQLEYPLKERELLLDIRRGLWSREDIITYAEQLEAEIEALAVSSLLPENPRYKEIEILLMNMVEDFWNR